MYKARFVADRGAEYDFSIASGFDIDGLSGINVEIGTSQGFSQIGESVQTQSLNGKSLAIRGAIYQDIQSQKKQLSKVFAPFTSGRLIVNDKFYIYVYVKTSPTFAAKFDDGRFNIQLFAPFPFFRAIEDTYITIGELIKGFSFPVDYHEHSFGIRSQVQTTNVINIGDIQSAFKLVLSASDYVENPQIRNISTGEFDSFTGIMSPGDIIEMYRDDNGVLKVEKTDIDGQTEDAFSWLDEESNLFYLAVGDNVITASADDGYEFLTTAIVYNPPYGGIADGF